MFRGKGKTIFMFTRFLSRRESATTHKYNPSMSGMSNFDFGCAPNDCHAKK